MSENNESGGNRMETLVTLMREMRAHGAIQAKVGDMEVTLDPSWKAPLRPVSEVVQVADPASDADVDKKQEVGSDGLTAAQQREWYGDVIDAKET